MISPTPGRAGRASRAARCSTPASQAARPCSAATPPAPPAAPAGTPSRRTPPAHGTVQTLYCTKHYSSTISLGRGGSLPVCSGPTQPRPPGPAAPPPAPPQTDRQAARSPVNFREGRRSSDGLMAQVTSRNNNHSLIITIHARAELYDLWTVSIKKQKDNKNNAV